MLEITRKALRSEYKKIKADLTEAEATMLQYQIEEKNREQELILKYTDVCSIISTICCVVVYLYILFEKKYIFINVYVRF
jgi:hypothetical protein